MSTATAILEPCPNARKVKSIINRRERMGYKCKAICPLCQGTASVMTCPECDGCGLLRGAPCVACKTTGKVPGRKPEE